MPTALPRRSSRAPQPTSRQGTNDGLEHGHALRTAIRESKQAGDRIRAARAEVKAQRQPHLPTEGELADAMQRLSLSRVSNSSVHSDSSDDNDEAEIDEALILQEILAAIGDPATQVPVDVEYPDDPKNWKEAMEGDEASAWMDGAQEELGSLREMEVYKLVPRSQVPQGRKVLKGRFVCHRKRDESGNVIRHKVRFVLKGYEQIYGQDYTKTTSPTARLESFRALLHIAAAHDWDAQQIDVKTAFLYGLLPEDEVQYMEQPEGFEEVGKEDWVWQLQRGLYGMKQSGRIWNKTMHEAMVKWGFKRLTCEWCVYYRKTPNGVVLVAVHVDDMLTVSSSREENERFKQQLQEKWKISDMGDIHFALGIAVERDRSRRTISLSQTSLIGSLSI